MILYYTALQKTKIFAEALSSVTGLPCYQLKSKLERKSRFLFMIHALFLAVTGKEFPAENMPGKIDVNEIYLCAPIWGGRMASPAWFFLNRANLKGKKVNLLLTSGSNNDNYRTKAIGTLAQLDCVPGEVYGFAAVKEPEMELIEEQLRQMLPGDIF